MQKLNFEDNNEWEILLNFRWPHEGFSIGYDFINPDDINNYFTANIYLGFVTVIIHWGYVE